MILLHFPWTSTNHQHRSCFGEFLQLLSQIFPCIQWLYFLKYSHFRILMTHLQIRGHNFIVYWFHHSVVIFIPRNSSRLLCSSATNIRKYIFSKLVINTSFFSLNHVRIPTNWFAKSRPETVYLLIGLSSNSALNSNITLNVFGLLGW